MFIAYQDTDLDVLTGSTEKTNFQKDMGPDITHLPCESFNWFRMNRSIVKIVFYFVYFQDNAVKQVESP